LNAVEVPYVDAQFPDQEYRLTSSDRLAKLLHDVEGKNSYDSATRVIDYIKIEYGIGPSNYWKYQIGLIGQPIRRLSLQSILKTNVSSLFVYSTAAKSGTSGKRDLVFTDAVEEIWFDTAQSEEFSEVGIDRFSGFFAWNLKVGILVIADRKVSRGSIAGGSNAPDSPVFLIDRSGKLIWNSRMDCVKHKGHAERMATTGMLNATVELVDAEKHVAFFVNGTSEHSVTVFNKSNGEIAFSWSTNQQP